MGISNVSSGLRPGVCTSTTLPTTPYDGQVVYETDTDCFSVWNGSSWISYSPRIPQAKAVHRTLAAANNFSNQTSYVDFPNAADKTALDLTFTKLRSDTKLIVSASMWVDFSSGVSQRMFMGMNIAGTDYDIAIALFPQAVFYGTLFGTRELTGINSGSLSIKPRFKCGAASAITAPITTTVSYSVVESF